MESNYEDACWSSRGERGSSVSSASEKVGIVNLHAVANVLDVMLLLLPSCLCRLSRHSVQVTLSKGENEQSHCTGGSLACFSRLVDVMTVDCYGSPSLTGNLISLAWRDTGYDLSMVRRI